MTKLKCLICHKEIPDSKPEELQYCVSCLMKALKAHGLQLDSIPIINNQEDSNPELE